MRGRICLWRELLPAALFLAATCGHAQFQQPTSEELKMTSDPKAPGAAAVYLYREETDNDERHVRSFYARIKILTEKGKEQATINVAYANQGWEVTDIKARTIHSDGTVIPLEGKPEDLLLTKEDKFKLSRKVFNLPSVEVGSILEYRYDLRYDSFFAPPEWDVQLPLFVHKSHYSFEPFDNFKPGVHLQSNKYLIGEGGRPINALLWWTNLPAGAKLVPQGTRAYVVDLENVPAAPDEEYMPPSSMLLYKVRFYYKSTFDVNDYWKSASKDWSKSVDQFAEENHFLKEEVAKIVVPTDSDLDKAKKLYAAVQALDNTDYSRQKTESERQKLKLKDIKHAEDVWKQKSGWSNQIALLYLAMLRAAGLKAYGVKVVDRDDGVFDPSYMYLNQLDSMLVQTTIDGKSYTLDPGEKMCPFGAVSWKHAGVRGLGQADKEPGLAEMPHQSYRDNSTTRTGMVVLDEHGKIASSSVQFSYAGQSALRWRQKALLVDADELKKAFDEDLAGQTPEGVEAHLDHFQGLENPEANLVAFIKVSGQVGTATAKRIVLPGHFFAVRGHRPFVDQEKRLTPVDMHYAEKVTDQISYKFPQGYAVEGTPANDSFKWENHTVYMVKSAQQPGMITLARYLARAFDQAKPEEYKDLRGFYQKVAAADQQQLVLVKASADAPAGKGN